MWKKILKVMLVIIILPVLLLALLFVGSPIYNEYLLYGLSSQLKEYPLPVKTEFIELESVCGKLNGNGNGMNFCACLLVKSELSAEEIKSHYKKAKFKPAVNEKWSVDVLVFQPTGEKFENDYLEHRNVIFDNLIDKNNLQGYHVVMAFDGGYWGGFDLRAH